MDWPLLLVLLPLCKGRARCGRRVVLGLAWFARKLAQGLLLLMGRLWVASAFHLAPCCWGCTLLLRVRPQQRETVPPRCSWLLRLPCNGHNVLLPLHGIRRAFCCCGGSCSTCCSLSCRCPGLLLQLLLQLVKVQASHLLLCRCKRIALWLALPALQGQTRCHIQAGLTPKSQAFLLGCILCCLALPLLLPPALRAAFGLLLQLASCVRLSACWHCQPALCC